MDMVADETVVQARRAPWHFIFYIESVRHPVIPWSFLPLSQQAWVQLGHARLRGKADSGLDQGRSVLVRYHEINVGR
jgi:hypothetical protein